MRLLLAIITLAMVATSADADVGIGVSAKTDNVTIYVPVTVRRFMFEPYVRATDQETDYLVTTGTTFPFTSTISSKFRANHVGLGVFRLVPLSERVTLYYGGRLARVDEETTTFNTVVLSPVPSSPESQSNDVEGHLIVPTLGFHYNIVRRLSIGAEIGLQRADLKMNTVSRSQNGATTLTSHGDVTTTDTRADVILRFFF